MPSGQETGGENGTFQIHYFATASSYTGKQTESLPAPLPLSRLFDTLEARYPGIRERVLRSCGVSVGLEYVDVEEAEELERERERDGNGGKEGGNGEGEGMVVIIKAGDEVGIIPPVSSG